MSDNLLTRVLAALAPWQERSAWVVGFSGGLDSTVLLHVLVQAHAAQRCPPVRAVHVQHNLQAAALAWPAHCAAQCAQWGVPLTVHSVTVGHEGGLEQAARSARYEAFQQSLNEGDALLLAQHQDDQAETVLFRLVRGTGVRGLAAIPKQRMLGKHDVLRPLLDISRAELERYAQQHQLKWVEDPTNAQSDYSRNWLRHEVLPLLQQRWPQADKAIARAASHCAEAQDLLDEVALEDWHSIQVPAQPDWLALPVLSRTQLMALSSARQRNVLRFWCERMDLMAPDTQHWQGFDQLLHARSDGQARWELTLGAWLRSGDFLWWLPREWEAELPSITALPLSARMSLPLNGELRIEGSISADLRLSYRVGGEQMELPQRGRRDLKRLLNELAWPPFLRKRVPMLWKGEALVAVANAPQLSVGEWRLTWQPEKLPTTFELDRVFR